MPTCGNCKKSVSESDVTCPHCGVLLAAYNSPAGSVSESTYVAPEQPPSADIPDVDLTVKPPVEAAVVTDPTKVAVPVVSTAPKPLFDTNLTVEDISKAAEGDHAEDVVTVSNKKIETQAPTFDVPDYARPPADAAPIPVVEDAEASIPLITTGTVGTPSKREEHAESGKTDESSTDENPDDDESDAGGESWLSRGKSPKAPSRPEPKPKKRQSKPKPKPKQSEKPTADKAEKKATTTPEKPTNPAGTTDDYLRKLHARVGYVPETETVSRPVDTGSKPQTKPSKNDPTPAKVQDPQATNTAKATGKPNTGCISGYALVLIILWISTITSTLSGSPAFGLFIITAIATWGYAPIRKASKNFTNR